jgi:hypothetical protein
MARRRADRKAPHDPGLAQAAAAAECRAMEPRVKAGIWVSMATRLSDIAGRPAAVLRKGDPDSGGILCVLRGREGLLVLSQVRDAEGRPAWLRATGEAPVDDATADAYVDRQVKRDPDLWVVEFEAPDLKPPFEAKLL